MEQVISKPIELSYAPPGTDPKTAWVVIVWGLLSTGAALLGVWAWQMYGQYNLMGLYANFVIPVGAIIVGLVAGAGYGIASWLTGVRIRGGMLAAVVIIQVLAYFGAKYLEYDNYGALYLTSSNTLTRVAVGTQLSFPEYFDYETRSITFRDRSSRTPGLPLGARGYFFKLLEIAGFALGGIIVPLSLIKTPYCELCQRYMKTKTLATISAQMSVAQVEQRDRQEPNAGTMGNYTAVSDAQQTIATVVDAVRGKDAEKFREQMWGLAVGTNFAEQSPKRIQFKMSACDCCKSGRLAIVAVAGHGKQMRSSPLSNHELHRDLVTAMNGKE